MIQYIKHIVYGKIVKRIGHASGGEKISQKLGSNILVSTVRSKPILVKFKYSQFSNLTGKKNTYETIAKHQFACENMTISGLDPINDLLMTHALAFSYNKVDDHHSWYWISYCFR